MAVGKEIQDRCEERSTNQVRENKKVCRNRKKGGF